MLSFLENHQSDAISHRSEQQRCQCIVHSDLCRPLRGMDLLIGSRQCHNAGHIERDREDEGQRLRL